MNEETVKLVIIGAGPAGYAAAIYTGRAQLEPLVLAGEKSGGQLMLTTKVENYPGFTQGIEGPQLMMDMRGQAERFGSRVLDQNVLSVDFRVQPFQIKVGSIGEGKPVNRYQAETIIIATGAESVTLDVPGEREYIGRGVSYCAVCDGAFFKDKAVWVVGGGDAAMEDTLALTKFAREITIIHRRDAFKASKIMQQRVLEDHKDKVKVSWNSEVVEVIGDQRTVTGIKIKNNQNNEIQELPAEGVFVAIGHKPASEFLEGQVSLNEKGYIITGLTSPSNDKQESLWLGGYPTMTSVPGVFAAGDNVDFRYRQAVTAAGMGVMAALDAEWWLDRT
jgi:thioredoxin reductase (NADPH)